MPLSKDEFTIFIETQFTDSVTVTTVGANISNVSTNENITGVSVTFAGDQVNFTGKYSLALFPSTTIVHITRGSSNKKENPIVSISFDELNNERQVYAYYAPTESRKIVTYDITYDYIDPETSNNVTETATYIHNVDYNYDPGNQALRRFA